MSTTDSDLDRLCGDYPEPCNCDDPATHDGAVEVEATYDSSTAANWRAAMEEFEGNGDAGNEAAFWYSPDSPIYSEEPTPAELEAARRFIAKWLQGDNHGFIIPGTEWGLSLKGWLNVLIANPLPGAEEMVDEQPPTIAEDYARGISLLEQVKQRRLGPNHWIHTLQWDRHVLDFEPDPDDLADALAEAKRMKAEDEAATRSMLGRN